VTDPLAPPLSAAPAGLSSPQPHVADRRADGWTATAAPTIERAALTAPAVAARLRALFDLHVDAVLAVGPDGTVGDVNAAAATLLGVSVEALRGRPLVELMAPDDRARCEERLEAALAGASQSWEADLAVGLEGRSAAQLSAVPITQDGTIQGVFVVAHDVSSHRTLEAQLAHRAFHDPLTGLANRALFRDRVEQALARDPSGEHVAVIFVDLDDFKKVNDTQGHAAGDALLVRVAAMLLESTRGCDLIARFGGDEFAVLLARIAHPDHVSAVAARIAAALRRPIALPERAVVVGASLGIARGHPATNADELLREADLAMYRAKAAGKGHLATYAAGALALAEERAALTDDLRRALEGDASGGRLSLVYQPVVELATGRVSTYEALARWWHPARGEVPPSTFVPLAEDTGLVVTLGRWVLRAACAQLQRWQAAAPEAERPTVRVNMSRCELEQPTLLRDVADALESAGITGRPADARAARVGRHAPPRGGAGHAARTARAGRATGHRRLRHRCLVARPPAALPGRRAEDRSRLRERGARGRGGRGGGARHDRARARAAAAPRGRGGRAPVAARLAGRRRLRHGAGLSVRRAGRARPHPWRPRSAGVSGVRVARPAGRPIGRRRGAAAGVTAPRDPRDGIARARSLLGGAERLLVFTGAGVSAESGVPTFRGAGGVWNSLRAEELATPQAFARDPRLVWEWYGWRRELVATCLPNPAHHAVARVAAARPDTTVVTQNVDGLHQRAAAEAAAGARPVVALHGTLFGARCLRWPQCDTRGALDGAVDAASLATLPRCERCGALLRPDVVWFGESLDLADLEAAFDAAGRADACLVIGTSAMVQPAASVAAAAARAGAPLIEVNAEATPLTSHATVSLRGRAADLVPQLLEDRAG
jgi:diguanylate cyclase (GGDEF)-like protein/PAS domain S-box-containing protein